MHTISKYTKTVLKRCNRNRKTIITHALDCKIQTGISQYRKKTIKTAGVPYSSSSSSTSPLSLCLRGYMVRWGRGTGVAEGQGGLEAEERSTPS